MCGLYKVFIFRSPIILGKSRDSLDIIKLFSLSFRGQVEKNLLRINPLKFRFCFTWYVYPT